MAKPRPKPKGRTRNYFHLLRKGSGGVCCTLCENIAYASPSDPTGPIVLRHEPACWLADTTTIPGSSPRPQPKS